MWVINNEQCINMENIKKIWMKNHGQLNKDSLHVPSFVIYGEISSNITIELFRISDEDYRRETLDKFDENEERIFYEIIKFLEVMEENYDLLTMKEFVEEAEKLVVPKIKDVLKNIE